MPKPTTPTAPMVSYKIVGAANACQVSADYIRQALRATDPNGYPRPLEGRRLSDAPNAEYRIEHDALVRWIRSYPEAS